MRTLTQSQEQPKKLGAGRYEPDNPKYSGEVGDPTIWWNDKLHPMCQGKEVYLGAIFSTDYQDRYWVYIVKEYKDGWWKLEWPD